MEKSERLEVVEEKILEDLENLNLAKNIEQIKEDLKALSMINPVIVSLKIREEKEKKKNKESDKYLVDPSNNLPF